MSQNELVSYIVRQLRACVPEQEIQNALEKNGWSAHHIQEAFQTAHVSLRSQNQDNLCAVRVDLTGTSQHVIAPTHKRTKKYMIVCMAILFFVVAGGVFAYMQYTQSPSRILSQMFDAIPSVQSMEATSLLAVDITIPTDKIPPSLIKTFSYSSPSVDVHFSLSTSQFIRFVGQDDGSFKFGLNAEYKDSLSQIPTLHLTVDSFGTKDMVYGKVGGISDILFHLSGAPTSTMSFLENQWFYIDKKSATQDANSLAGSFQNSSKNTSTSSTQNASSFTEKKAQILSILNEYKNTIILDSKNLGKEKIDGIPTTHIFVTLNESQLLEMLNKIKNTLSTSENPTKNIEGPTPIDSFDIWVGESDHLPHKLRITPASAFLSKIFKDTPIVSKNIEFTISHITYNTTLSITPPRDAKNLEEVLGQILGGLFGSNTVNKKVK